MATSVIQSTNSIFANSFIELVTDSTVASGGTAVLPYPESFDKTNTRVVYSHLYLSNNVDRYPSAVEVQILGDAGITAKNVGGAAGRIILGIVKKR